MNGSLDRSTNRQQQQPNGKSLSTVKRPIPRCYWIQDERHQTVNVAIIHKVLWVPLLCSIVFDCVVGNRWNVNSHNWTHLWQRGPKPVGCHFWPFYSVISHIASACTMHFKMHFT